ncbi:hypothetical protein MKW94_012005 [Papaver nudicaule]|uniref:Protein kinase domain-containing protein n=1 Tax=Papaver nudicaule TaxID=74823 RepID=A0AA41VPV8_PAPNU|nr:hypothetical protein [Papaver nudicaule]
MVRQDVFLLLTFSVIAFLIAHIQSSAAFCDQNCPGSSQNLHLPFPYGFSEGCHIRLNCIKGEVFVGDEFRVQNVTSDGLLINIPPKCNRSIETLKPLYSSNYALTSRNGLLLQNCTTKPKDCVIPESLLRLQFRTTDCEHLYCYSAKVGEERVRNGEGGSFLSFDNITSTGCKFLYSSVAVVVNSSSMVSLEFRTLHLSYWLNGSCNCSSNANCTEITSPVDQTGGYRCQCVNGYEGDGYAMGSGCLKASKCNPDGYWSRQCGGTTRLAFLIAGVIAGASLMAGIAFLCYTYRRRSALLKYRKSTKQLLSEAEGSCNVPFYRFKEMKRATYGFSEKHRLGTGAYGTVYAGKLRSDDWVAIKRIRYRDADSTEQVINEVKLLSSVTHPNLVRLLGFCLEKDEQILVYEFMPNGTLSQHLQRERGTGLSWVVRLTIATETAQAIAHLHSALDPPIYHRDVKSSNILLDFNFNSKVADFGLSRLGMTEMSHISTVPQGTPGYLDPQYHQNFHLSDRSDVYSFGVVLVEILSGLKVVDFTRPPNEVNLANFAMEKIRMGCLDEIIDPFLEPHKNAWTLSSMHKVGELAFRCLAFHSETRPSMMEVAAELENIMLSGCVPVKAKELELEQEEENICIGSAMVSCCSSLSNTGEKSQNLTDNMVGLVDDEPKGVSQQMRPGEEVKACSHVTLEDLWLNEESSSPSSNSLLSNVV